MLQKHQDGALRGDRWRSSIPGQSQSSLLLGRPQDGVAKRMSGRIEEQQCVTRELGVHVSLQLDNLLSRLPINAY